MYLNLFFFIRTAKVEHGSGFFCTKISKLCLSHSQILVRFGIFNGYKERNGYKMIINKIRLYYRHSKEH